MAAADFSVDSPGVTAPSGHTLYCSQEPHGIVQVHAMRECACLCVCVSANLFVCLISV